MAINKLRCDDEGVPKLIQSWERGKWGSCYVKLFNDKRFYLDVGKIFPPISHKEHERFEAYLNDYILDNFERWCTSWKQRK